MRSLNFTPNPISLLNPKTKYNRSLNCQNRCRRCSSAVWNAALANVVPTWMVWLGLRPTWYRRGAYVVIWSRKNKKPVGLDVSYTQKKNKNGWDPPSSLLPSPYPPPPCYKKTAGAGGGGLAPCPLHRGNAPRTSPTGGGRGTGQGQGGKGQWQTTPALRTTLSNRWPAHRRRIGSSPSAALAVTSMTKKKRGVRMRKNRERGEGMIGGANFNFCV